MRPVRMAAAHLVERMILRDLRTTFRRVVWVGAPPAALVPPAGAPLAIYANHHYFHDGYLLWLLVRHHLRRRLVIWMRDWERAPLFAPIGALPFPEDDRAARLATVRETSRRLRGEAGTIFLYYPEGDLRPPDSGIGPFETERFARLARIFPDDVAWWPVAMHVTWWGEDRPTAVLAAGNVHRTPDGQEQDRLEALLARARGVRPGDDHLVLLDGRRSAQERWNLRVLAPLFKRLL
jgi:hypothetical protein